MFKVGYDPTSLHAEPITWASSIHPKRNFKFGGDAATKYQNRAAATEISKIIRSATMTMPMKGKISVIFQNACGYITADISVYSLDAIVDLNRMVKMIERNLKFLTRNAYPSDTLILEFAFQFECRKNNLNVFRN